MKKAAILLVSCFVFVACPAERYWSFCSYNLTKQDLFFVYDFFLMMMLLLQVRIIAAASKPLILLVS